MIAHGEHYKGYRIFIEHDDSPECPWTAWDNYAPVLTYTNDGISAYGYDLRKVPELTIEQFKANIDEFTSHNGITDIRGWLKDTYRSPGLTLIEWVNEYINEFMLDSVNGSDLLSSLECVWRWAGYDTLEVSRSGYSQGEWADLLVVNYDEDKIAPFDYEVDLNKTADLWAAWAYGDVYGYTVMSPANEEVASCCGYYGPYPDYGGAIDEAKGAVDDHLLGTKLKREAKLKDLIKHRCPYNVRDRILEGIR